ncbi:MAG: DNA-deoxyinosine glycosylase [Clostridiales bacterium]|nr:DNA-deoxyinosine glycosylase [Clostridiales bacterium]
MEFLHAVHTLAPIYDNTSEILILGSFPSVKSRETNFYYGHPRNRFWGVIAAVFGESVPETIEEKKDFLLRNHLAVWDVIASCEIAGSADSSIKNVVPNEIERIVRAAPISSICINGDKAYRLFLKYCRYETMPKVYKLPSTSPANAAWSKERLIEEWSVPLCKERKDVRREYEKN